MSVGESTTPTAPVCVGCPCRLYSLAALAFFVHNIEEIAGLVPWVQVQGLPVSLTQSQFTNAVLWLTLAALAILIAGRMAQFVMPLQKAVAVVSGALLANVAIHVILSGITWSYMPGLGTALVLVLPATYALAKRLPLERRTLWTTLGLGAVLMAPLTWSALWLAGV